MVTIGKEMAEVGAERLQLELEKVQDLIEELTLDLEKIKFEMSERAGGGTGESTVSKYEMKQSKQQISRYFNENCRPVCSWDTWVPEAPEGCGLKKNEIDELARTKQKLRAIVEDTKYHIADLQEQLQQELQHAKQEAREAVEAKDAHAEEMAELAEWNTNSTSITLSHKSYSFQDKEKRC